MYHALKCTFVMTLYMAVHFFAITVCIVLFYNLDHLKDHGQCLQTCHEAAIAIPEVVTDTSLIKNQVGNMEYSIVNNSIVYENQKHHNSMGGIGYSVFDEDHFQYDARLYVSQRHDKQILQIPSFLSALETQGILDKLNAGGEEQWIPNYSRTGTRQSRNNFLGVEISRRIGRLFGTLDFTCSGILQYRYKNAVGLHSDDGAKTILIYLNDVGKDDGGQTCFPIFHPTPESCNFKSILYSAICFQPQLGHLLLWENEYFSEYMSHEGMPISDPYASKYVITCQVYEYFRHQSRPNFYETVRFGGGNV